MTSLLSLLPPLLSQSGTSLFHPPPSLILSLSFSSLFLSSHSVSELFSLSPPSQSHSTLPVMLQLPLLFLLPYLVSSQDPPEVIPTLYPAFRDSLPGDELLMVQTVSTVVYSIPTVIIRSGDMEIEHPRWHSPLIPTRNHHGTMDGES